MAHRERASELEWLTFFYQHADFGPADSEARDNLKHFFTEARGKNLPLGFQYRSDGETTFDTEEE